MKAAIFVESGTVVPPQALSERECSESQRECGENVRQRGESV
jgi:hypothetical protein